MKYIDFTADIPNVYYKYMEQLQKLPKVYLGDPKPGVCLMSDKKRLQLRKKRKKK